MARLRIARRSYKATHDRKPRRPPGATSEDLARRAASEALLARISLILLLPIIVSGLVCLVHDLDFTLVVRALGIDEASVSPERVVALDERAEAIGLLPLIASFPFAIAFLLWVYRAFHNAWWLGAGRWMKFSPGGAIALFFVPIRNLYRPLQAFYELAGASEPAELDEPPRALDAIAGYREPALAPEGQPRTFRSPPLGLWWATWTGAALVGFVGSRVADSSNLAAAASGGLMLMLGDVLELAAAVLVGLVVTSIAGRRQEVFRRLEALVVPGVPEWLSKVGADAGAAAGTDAGTDADAAEPGRALDG